MSEAPLLAAVGVTYTYPAGPIALDHVDVEIARGERLALLGGNGSGKSTLLLLLNASLKPATGAVRLNGRNVGWSRRDRNQHRRRVGLVLQDPDDQLFSASVFEDVSFGPLNLGLDEAAARKRVEEMLDRLGLTELAERPAHLLSFGQRKRVAIAGVAAMQSEVVLLDEPFAGLDPTARHEVMATLDQLEADGATVALATHDVDLAYGWADRVVVLADGTVAAAGPPATVLHDAERCAAARLRRPGLVDLLDAAVDAGWLEQAEARRIRSTSALEGLIRARPRA